MNEIDEGNEYDQFAGWVGWEGGVMDLALHGVDEDEVPEGLKEVWAKVEKLADEYGELQNEVYRILDERSVTTNG